MKQVKKYTCLCITLGFFLITYPVVAADPETTPVEDEQPSYQNPSQAAHAANLAEAASMKPTSETQEAADELQSARDVYDINPDDPQALSNLEQARKEYANTIAKSTDELSDDIYEMRMEQQMGWGEIAHALGVHPSALALGHTKNTQGLLDPVDGEQVDMSGNELAKTTRRDKEFKQKESYQNKGATNSSSQKMKGKSNNGNKDKSNSGKSNNTNNGKGNSSNGKGKNK